ncbi:MAG: SH3 domain-containing protein [Bacteroidia bacterium]
MQNKKNYLFLFIVIICSSCQPTNNTDSNSNEKIRELEQKIEAQEKAIKDAEDAKTEKELKELTKQVEDLTKASAQQKKPETTAKITIYEPQRVYIAVINDPDGYTNVRNKPNLSGEIIDRLYEGETYEVILSDKNWWSVKTHSNVRGYVHKSRILILEEK